MKIITQSQSIVQTALHQLEMMKFMFIPLKSMLLCLLYELHLMYGKTFFA